MPPGPGGPAARRGWRPSRKVTSSAAPSPATDTSNRAEGMARVRSVDSISSARTGAAARRAAATACCGDGQHLPGGPQLGVDGGRRRSRAPPRPAGRPIRPAKATTSSSVPPYFRWSSWRSWRRARTSLEALGVVLPGLHHGPELGPPGRTARPWPPAPVPPSRPGGPDRPGPPPPRPGGRGRCRPVPRSGTRGRRRPPPAGRRRRPAAPPPPRGGASSSGSSIPAAPISSSWYRRRSASRARSWASPPRASRSAVEGADPGGGGQQVGAVDGPVAVEGVALGRRLHQGPVLVLAVELEQPGRRLGQRVRPAPCARRPTPGPGHRGPPPGPGSARRSPPPPGRPARGRRTGPRPVPRPPRTGPAPGRPGPRAAG